jgi:hypothetical protein
MLRNALGLKQGDHVSSIQPKSIYTALVSFAGILHAKFHGTEAYTKQYD